MRNILIYILLIAPLTASANTDTVSVAFPDRLSADTISHQYSTIISEDSSVDVTDTLTRDSIYKRPGFFKRVYRFLDKCFSPPRDLNYIDVQDYYNWCAMVQFTTRFEVYQMDAGAEDFILRMSPKPRPRVGPFFGWRFAFFGYNIDLKSIFMNKEDTDLSASIYSAAFGLDLFYRNVGGNYNISKLVVNNRDYSNQLNGKRFDGIRMHMKRISFYYIPNFRHYSHQAAFSQTHRQLISAGSLILGLQYAHNKCHVDWGKLYVIMPSPNPDTDQTNTPLQSSNSLIEGNQKNDEFSASVGYGYNWVFAKNWLLGAEFTGSIGYLLQHINTSSSVDENKGHVSFIKRLDQHIRKNVALGSNIRLALVYNCGPIYTGLQGVGFYYQQGNGVMMSRNFISSVYAFVGYNF